MRRLFLSVLLSLTVYFFFSCTKNKNEVAITPAVKPGITGEWEWIESYEGWSGGIIKPDEDSTVMLKLTSDSSYFVLLNNQIKYSGHFSSYIIPEIDSMIVLQFDKYIQVHKLRFFKEESVSYFQNDTCKLYDFEITDGNSHNFKRKQ